jgi:hypothetical protein
MASSVVVEARGTAVWERIARFKSLTPLESDRMAPIKPMTQFADGKNYLLFITGSVRYYGWYYQSSDDTLRHSNDVDFERLIMLGAFTKGVLSAEWTVTAYKALCSFALALVPGGFYLRMGVTVASLVAFWKHHEEEIEECMSLLGKIVEDLRDIYERCPKLGKAMLCVALQQTHLNISKESEKQGLVKLVVANLDTERWFQDIADLFGSLFKAALTRHSKGVIAGWLAEKGLKRLAKVAALVYKVNKAMKLVGKGANVARGPGIKNPQVLAAKFITIFSEAGISLEKKDARALASERGLQDSSTLDRLESLHNRCTSLEQLVIKLTNAAENEIVVM